MKILMVFATCREAGCLKRAGERDGEILTAGSYDISVLVTGAGSMATAWSMEKWLQDNEKPVLAINAGIAGSFNYSLSIGEVVMPVSDCFADMGIETENGFIPMKDTDLMEADKFPFTGGNIICSNEFADKASTIFRPVKSITVNMCSGRKTTIERLRRIFNPDIETMEGAAFFYVCSMEKIPFLALRAVSNRVGQGGRNKWNIPLAISNLSDKIEKLLLLLQT
ncbi:MAG: futalosine hydrolase [Bacteroidales bacterium]